MWGVRHSPDLVGSSVLKPIAESRAAKLLELHGTSCQNLTMIAKQPVSRLRSMALTVALFAITLAIFQPLSHAVMLRMGGLEAATALWGSLCQPSGETGEAESQGPANARVHDCCFGLAHAQAQVLPSGVSIDVEATETISRIRPAHHHPSTGAIRDGPNQPRAPPLPNV